MLSWRQNRYFSVWDVCVYRRWFRLERVRAGGTDPRLRPEVEEILRVRGRKMRTNVLVAGVGKGASIVSRCGGVEGRFFRVKVGLLPRSSGGVMSRTGKIDIFRFETFNSKRRSKSASVGIYLGGPWRFDRMVSSENDLIY